MKRKIVAWLMVVSLLTSTVGVFADELDWSDKENVIVEQDTDYSEESEISVISTETFDNEYESEGDEANTEKALNGEDFNQTTDEIANGVEENSTPIYNLDELPEGITLEKPEGMEMYDPNTEYNEGDTVVMVTDAEAEGDEGESFQLFATATYVGKCERYWKNIAGSELNLYYYVGDSTRKTYLVSGQTFYTDEVWRLSTGVLRYKSTNTWNSPTYGDLGKCYFEKTSAATWTIYHTYDSASSSHPHYRYCNIGDGAYITTTSTSCTTCYPPKLYYYANGGSGAPSSQSGSPITVSSTIPTRFPYTFKGWSTSSTSSSASYYPGNSMSLSAGTTRSLYAVWGAATTLSTDSQTTSSTYLGSKGSIAYYKFTPTVTATYAFESTGSSDTYGYIYNSSGSQLTSDDDSGDGSNFRVSRELTSGTTYYFGSKYYSSSTTGTIPVKLRRQYNIKYDANGGSSVPATQSKLHGDTLKISQVVPVKPSFMFKGWASSSSSETAEYSAGGNYTLNGDATLYAVWGYPSGSCGDNAVWTFRDNTLYITGSGAMTNYTTDGGAPWYQYVSNIEKIEIEDGITSIGNYAFSGCEKVTSMNLPDSITSIGTYAFSGCSKLTSINLPNGVKEIKNRTFNNCSSLTAIAIPSDVTIIGEYAFFGCSSLKTIAMPSSLSSLGTYAFANCSSIEIMNIPSGIETVAAYTFSGDSKLARISIPSTVKVIKEYAFNGCSVLSSVVIPSSVTEIERGAFTNCSSLLTVTIPDSVTTIGTSIFAYVRDNVTIRCYLDTAAHKYAIDNDIKYELIPWGVLEQPTFTSSEIDGGVTIAITAAKGDIYYTIDGTTPTTSSIKYTGPITVTRNITIKAIAVSDGWTNSEAAVYNTAVQQVSFPVPNIASGSLVTAGTKIELSCETEGAEIYCTTDGRVPTETDVYTVPIEINNSTVIYAYASKKGMIDSTLVVLSYQISNAEDAPEVTTLEATDITETSAKVSAAVNDNKGVLSGVQFVYYEKNNSVAKYTIDADSNYSAVLTGLLPNTEYWYQAKAENEKGWSYGYVRTFKTNAQGVIKPASIEIQPSYLSLNVGKKTTLLATVLPAECDNRAVYWSSDDTSVATVSSNGVVTAVGLGNTRIKATTVSNRLVAYCNIDVISSQVIGEFDFSEHNMITNSSNYDQYGYDHGVNAGGNALMASAYLARWDGAVLEENDTYPSSYSNIKYSELSPDYHVQNIIYLPYRTDNLDNDEIKNAVMKYGAVYTAFKVNYDYFDKIQTTYYLPQNVNRINGGHAIAIVGWDDNYSKKNFKTTPLGDGAFLCKNSWGTESGDGGYFYISYYDKCIAKQACGDYNAVFYDIESKDNYNKIYQYDYLGPVTSYNVGSKKAYFSNVFPEKGRGLEEDEQLQAVSFYNFSPGMSYEIYVVKNYSDRSSLSQLGSPVKTGVSDYAGYCTINLDEPIELTRGTRFAVVVKYSCAAENATIFVEAPTKINVGGQQVAHSSNARANKDESYISKDGKAWSDFTDFSENTNVCLKAFTSTENESVLLQGIDNVGREYETDTVYSIEELQEKGFEFNPEFIAYYNNDDVTLMSEDEDNNFGFSPPSVLPDLQTNNNYSEGSELPSAYDLRAEDNMTAVKNQGDIGSCWSFATYASLESAIKKASFLSNSLSGDGLNQAAGDAASIELDTNGVMLALGNSTQIKATVLPYDATAQIVWQSSNNRIASVNSNGVVTATGIGNAYITASSIDGKVSAKCAITVSEPVSVNAISINNTEKEITAGKQLLIDYTVYPENAGDKTVIWEVDNDAIANMDEYGILTAKGAGTVTVTAYSADRTVSAEYTVDIDDGFDCNIEISENNLKKYGPNIFGDLQVIVENKTNKEIDAQVIMAIYDSQNKLVSVSVQDKRLSQGENQTEFTEQYIPNIDENQYKVKVFVWDSTSQMQPLAISRESTIQ